jgi:hypothetical protein
MNDRAGRRRFRRTIARVQRFCDRMNRAWEAGVMSESAYRAELGIEPPYDRGGLIAPGRTPVRATLALDECVLYRSGVEWECGRTDLAHLDTERHRFVAAGGFSIGWSDGAPDSGSSDHYHLPAELDDDRPTE